MSHTVSVKIPEDVYSAIVQHALAAGRSVEDLIADWVAQHVKPAEPELTADEMRARRQWLEKYANLSPDTAASDNARIDSDLAKDSGR